MRDTRVAAVSVAILLLVSAVALVLVAEPARATTYPAAKYHFDGTVAGERSGTSALLMDLNGDGVADLVVGAPYNGTSSSGSVTFFLSANVGGNLVPFATAITVFGWSNSYFGWSLANLGNFAGHGPTLAVGAPFASPNGHAHAGNVTLFYARPGFAGIPGRTINSTNDGEELGFSLAAAGDVNGDGYGDLIAGAPLSAGGNGRAYVFLGGNPPAATPAMTYTTASTGAHFGFSVAGNGSVDGNSALDVAVGAPDQNSGAGAVYVIRNLIGSGGSINRTNVVAGLAAGDHFGYSVAMGDFNGDTFADVAVGAPYASGGAGTVSVLYGGSKFSGAIGTTLTGAAGESFGVSVAAGNFHRDRYTDLLVGAQSSTLNSTGIGRAYAFYGGTNLATSPNLTLAPSSGDSAFGSTVSVGGDFDGDGGPDFVVADPQFTSGASANVGRAYVYNGTVVPTFANPVIQGWVCQPNTWNAATKTCRGLQGFTVTLDPAGVMTTTVANGSFTFRAVPGSYYINATLFPYIENTTTLSVVFNSVYTVLVFPLKIPQVYGIVRDAVNRTAFSGVTVALYNATGVFVNSTLTPGTSSRNYSIYIPTAFLPGVGASLGLTVKAWDATHYLNTTAVNVARNQTANASLFLNRFPAVSGYVRDVSTTFPISGATVWATQGATVLGTVTTNNVGFYHLIAVNASVPAGVFINITASKYERDQLTLSVDKNQSYWENQSLQGDTIPPTSSISPLLPTYTNTPIVTITATATDNYPNNVAQVQLYYRFNNTGSFALYRTDTAAPYVFSFNSTAARGDGTYSFYTIATDYGGNRQATPSGNMTWTVVDTRPPTSALSALPTYETVANFTLYATASDWNRVSQVALYYRKGTSGAYTLLSADTASPYTWSFNTTLLGTGDGVYQFYSLATDAAGNMEPVPASPDTQTAVDTTAPVTTITAPTSGQVVGTGWVNVTWTSTDATSGIARFDAKLDSGTWVHAGTSLYYNFTGVADGAHTVAVNATDLAGNSKAVSVDFTVNTVTPVVTISAPTAGSYATSSSLQVTWAVSNTGAGLASIQVRLDSGPWQTLAPTATSYTFTAVTDGAHTAYVQALGLNGAVATASVAVTVDATAPTVSITSPVTNLWTKNTSVTVSFGATDATSGILRVMLSVDGGTPVNVTGTSSYSLSGLSDGSHTVTISATDHAGNTATTSVAVKVDTTPPAVTITAPSAGASLSSPDVTLTWTATDAGSGVATVQVAVDNGTYQTVSGTSTTLSSLAAGTHTATLRVADAVGNVRSVSVTFSVVPTTPPSGLDPLVVAAVGAGVVVVIVAIAAALYLRRRKPSAPETPPPPPEPPKAPPK